MIIYGPDTNGDGSPDGVWILQNSWNQDAYDEYYITYRSKLYELYGVKTIVDKDWDNCYNISNCGKTEFTGVDIAQQSPVIASIAPGSNEKEYEAITGAISVTYDKPNFKREELKSINFTSASQNSKYRVYISTDGAAEHFQYIKDVDTELPGMYTVYFENIMLENDKFSIKIETDYGAVYPVINAFTSDAGSIDVSDEITSYVDGGNYNDEDKYEYHVICKAKNMDGELIKFVLRDKDRNILQSTVRKTAVFRNGQAIGTVVFDEDYNLDEMYYVYIYHGDDLIGTVDIKYNPTFPDSSIEGEGTDENPYIITNAYQLSLISKSPHASYVLGNDIDLSYNKDNSATFNNGFGWIPIELFTGKLDGQGHSINNMRVLKSERSNVGLFGKLQGATVSNLSIKNASINAVSKGRLVGILAGEAMNVSVDNVLVSGDIKAQRFFSWRFNRNYREDNIWGSTV